MRKNQGELFPVDQLGPPRWAPGSYRTASERRSAKWGLAEAQLRMWWDRPKRERRLDFHTWWERLVAKHRQDEAAAKRH